jgi:14-3-3 protein epsilon
MIYYHLNYFLLLGESDKLALIQGYKKKIEKELEGICSDILEIIKNELIPNSDSEEGKVFYYKMKGDYYRYIAEYSTGDKKNQAA